ncbi:MAG: ubiquinol-cytochrome C chaperone [Ancylobacter novellus]|uniref:Ubiquinol-cytochrome C chaperone n=1 Tax=Ancylobacter novellus TaxID=921 RepID=A0A2W5KR76_ANCNO|nr:MAG: ubiquinol-cytochrome C chaperone [Ancylobacter novellus]
MIFGLFRKSAPETALAADAVYASVVAAARRPEFYRDLGAPDTLPGRFELIVLHAALLNRRLARDPDPRAQAFAQDVFDAMFRALDANLREIGVGDITVPKRVKAMARSYYDGAKVYDAALDARDEAALAAALGRIVYAGEAPDEERPRRLAAYAIRADAALAAQAAAELEVAGPAYPDVTEDLT